MQIGQHIEACQRFLDDALALESRGSHMGAAEMIWGATVQVLEAIGHIRAGNATGNLSRNGRRRLAGSAIFEGLQHYDQIRVRLHAHFYDGHLTTQERGSECGEGANLWPNCWRSPSPQARNKQAPTALVEAIGAIAYGVIPGCSVSSPA